MNSSTRRRAAGMVCRAICARERAVASTVSQMRAVKPNAGAQLPRFRHAIPGGTRSDPPAATGRQHGRLPRRWRLRYDVHVHAPEGMRMHSMAETIPDAVVISIPFAIVFFVGFGLGLMTGGFFREKK
jgi:hypothetical protein